MAREIQLTQGQIAIVDDEDFEYLSQWKWCAVYFPSANVFYAERQSRKGEFDKPTKVKMHRQLMGFPEGLFVDHINHNTLDNRRENLRIATRKENNRNSKKKAYNKSGYKGVSWNSNTGKWRAQINVDGKVIHLGLFLDPAEAHEAYKAAAILYFGDFAYADS